MTKKQQVKTGISAANRKDKPRFIVIHEYNGKQSMRAAFEQAIETQALGQFELWLEKQNNGKTC